MRTRLITLAATAAALLALAGPATAAADEICAYYPNIHPDRICVTY